MPEKDLIRLDANETAFFKRELEYVKATTYDTKYKNLKATSLIPVSTETPSGTVTITYRKFTKVGTAKIVSDYANDFPRVDVYGEEVSANVRGVGESFGYNIVEIRRSQREGKNLDQRRADAARQASEEKMNSIALTGDSEFGLQGLIDYPGITEYTVPSGEAGYKTWASKTPDEIVADITGLIDAIADPTNGVEIPDTLILPFTQFNYIANTRMTDGDSKTILRYIQENNPYITTIDWLNELKGAGAAGTDRMMAYAKDEKHLTFEIPQMFEMASPQQQGMEFVVNCYAETGGVIVYYPQSVAYGDGI